MEAIFCEIQYVSEFCFNKPWSVLALSLSRNVGREDPCVTERGVITGLLISLTVRFWPVYMKRILSLIT